LSDVIVKHHCYTISDFCVPRASGTFPLQLRMPGSLDNPGRPVCHPSSIGMRVRQGEVILPEQVS